MSIAILTGASAGLGKSFFASLQKRHPDLTGIWLIARRRERLEAMAEGCPIPVTVIPPALTDPDAYDALGEKLQAMRKDLARLQTRQEEVRREFLRKEDYTDIIEELKHKIERIDKKLGVKKS